jgi:hypothetical protein
MEWKDKSIENKPTPAKLNPVSSFCIGNLKSQKGIIKDTKIIIQS